MPSTFLFDRDELLILTLSLLDYQRSRAQMGVCIKEEQEKERLLFLCLFLASLFDKKSAQT